MHKLGKQLNLQPLQIVRLIEIEEQVEKKGFMSIEDFRELIQFTPGISTQLNSVIELPMHESIAIIKRRKFTTEMFYEMISEYKERVGI